jgi:hypothetical protein
MAPRHRGQRAAGYEVGAGGIGTGRLLALELLQQVDVGEHVDLGGDAELQRLFRAVAEHVGVCVDQPRQESFACALDHYSAGRHADLCAHVLYLAIAHQNRGFINDTFSIKHPYIAESERNRLMVFGQGCGR